jgi:hypothetical protein
MTDSEFSEWAGEVCRVMTDTEIACFVFISIILEMEGAAHA